VGYLPTFTVSVVPMSVAESSKILKEMIRCNSELVWIRCGKRSCKPFRWPRVKILCVDRQSASGRLESDGAPAAEWVRHEERITPKFYSRRIEKRAGKE